MKSNINTISDAYEGCTDEPACDKFFTCDSKGTFNYCIGDADELYNQGCTLYLGNCGTYKWLVHGFINQCIYYEKIHEHFMLNKRNQPCLKNKWILLKVFLVYLYMAYLLQHVPIN